MIPRFIHGITRFGVVLMLWFCLPAQMVAQNVVQVGSGTAVTGGTEPSPINIYYRSLRYQVVYTAAEMTAAGASAGLISALGFEVVTPPTYDLPNYTISIKHTTATSASTYDPGPFTAALNIPLHSPTPGGFDILPLDVPFFWNGTDNIILDICFDRVPDFVSDGTVTYFSSTDAAHFERDDDTDLCGATTFNTADEKPNIVFEFIGTAANDAGVTSVDSFSAFCAGTHPIYATVQNFGINTISGVTVNWEFDGILQTPITVSTPIDTFGGTGSTELQVLLGSKTFVSGTSYPIKVWTSMPNGVSDTTNVNDTLTATLTPSLMGTYTIGGTSPDFPSFSDAVSVLNAVGVCGAVTFKVRDGLYSESVSIGQIAGASAMNPIIFESESGDSSLVTLTNGATTFEDNYTLRLDGSDYVTFRKMTIEAVGTFYAKAIVLQNGASNNTFENNLIKGTTSTSTSENRALITVTGASDNGNHNNLFQYNFLADGSYGFYWIGAFSNRDSMNTIRFNEMNNQYYHGGFFSALRELKIEQNTITTTSSTFYYGLQVRNISTDLSIIANHITEAGMGIYIDDCDASAANRFEVINNFIHTKGTSSSERGINIESSSYIDIIHNTVNTTGSSTSNAAFRQAFQGNNRLFNNIFANTGAGYFGVIVSSTLDSSDYNNWYAAGSANPGIVGGTVVNNLSEWQTETGEDANSLDANPFFTTPNNFVIQNNTLNAAGTPIASVTTDITGEPRSLTTPDIGADEFIPSAVDIGVTGFITPNVPFTTGIYPIKAIVKNNGSTTITSFSVGWEANTVTQTPVSWTGSLTTGDTVEVLLDNLNFTADTSFNITAWSLSPNGGVDAFILNDTSSINDLAAALSGIYTIGGTNPDFQTFTDAVNALDNGGVAGAVTFNVRDGIYNEQITIEKVGGASVTNTITFQFESGDSSSSVGLTFMSSNFNEPATVTLDGAEWIIFKDLSIQATGTFYANPFHLKNGASNIMIENCRITGVATTSTSTSYALIRSEATTADQNHNNTYRYNTLLNGSHGIYTIGNFTLRDTGTVVMGNTLTNQYTMGINTQNQQGIQIFENYVTTNTAYNFYYGIYTYYNQGGMEVRRNKVIGSPYIGVYLLECDGTTLIPTQVTNNFIQVTSTSGSASSGIFSSSSDYVNLHYNSVLNTHANTSSRAMYWDGGLGIDAANNNFAHTGGGYSIATGFVLPTPAQHNYNNLYTTGTNLANAGGTDYADLLAWRTATNLDTNSISTDPQYLSNTDLHTTNIALNGKGVIVTSTSIDIDKEARQNPPDIGADEFVLIANDAAVTMLDNPTMPFAAGSQNLEVTLTNNGTSTLTSATLNFSINGIIQSPYNWTGSLATGQSVGNINIGSVDFVVDSAFTLQVWSSNPNGTTDQNTSNDTLTADSLYAGLSGTYTLGGANPDFDDFQSTINAMDKGGVLGAVTFNVRNGTYGEQLNFENYSGISSINTITYQSESGDSSAVTLQWNSSTSVGNYTIRFDGANHYRFRKMTIKALNSSFMRAISMQNGASNNIIANNRLEGTVSSRTSSDAALLYGFGTFNNSVENNQITDNYFVGGGYAIYLNGSSSTKADSNLIQYNTIEDAYYFPIYVDEQRDIEIDKNTITHSGSPYFSSSALYVNDSRGAVKVTKNKITGNYDDGIFLVDVVGDTTNRALVANNMVALPKNSTDYGIYLTSADFIDVVHNSVRMDGSSTFTRAFYITANSNDNTIRNNIFANFGSGYAIYSGNTNSTQNIFDYNNLYTNGTNLGYWGANVTDLSTWQTTSTQAANSLNVDPSFISTTDLHIDQTLLNNAALSLPYITDDIDGEPRGTLADIGADEFTPITGNDAGIFTILEPAKPFAAGSQTVKAVIRNYGANALTSATVQWTVDGALQPAYNWTGNLASSEEDTVALGTYTFNAATSYFVESFTILPNGVIDTTITNDTASQTLYPALIGTYTIGGTNPDFTFIADAVNALNQGGVIGAVTFNIRTGTYGEQIELQPIDGASDANRITFQSEVGDSTAVLLAFSANSVNNYTLRLNGADYLTFKNMTIKANNSTYGRVILLENRADNNSFENNILEGISTSSTSNIRDVVFTNNNLQNSNNTFAYNHIFNGARGIYFNNPFLQYADSATIVGNIFENQYIRGFDANYIDGLYFHGNTMLSTSNYTALVNIDISAAKGNITITNNKLSNNSGAYGIYLSSVQPYNTNPATIANNFIQIGGTGSSEGIYCISSRNINIDFNSINQTSTGTFSTALLISGGDSINVRNNILKADQGYAYTFDAGIVDESNHNDIISNSATIIRYNGIDYATLAAFQAATIFDPFSISIDPQYTSLTDLHVNEITLNNKGKPLPHITTDIDGEARNVGTPDIGADEFTPPTDNDAGIIAFDAPIMPFAEGTRDVKAILRNFGTNSLTSATINWSVNNAVQSAYSWSGNLAAGTTDTVTIGTFNFDVGQPYDITAYTTSPNGATDTLNFNDTATVSNLYAALSGTYTIAGTLPDFTTLTNAVNALKSGGVVGAVTFNIRNGIFTEQIEITSIQGASATNTITIQSEALDSNLVTLRYDANGSRNYTVYLNGASYVTFKNMTIEALDNIYSTVVRMNGANNHLIGNILKGQATTSTSSIRSVVYINNTVMNSTIEYNQILDNAYGIYLNVFTSNQTGVKIIGNTLTNQYTSGMFGYSLLAPQILSNTITTNSAYSNYSGLYFDDFGNEMRIEKNRIYGEFTGVGIFLNDFTGNALRGRVFNNFIQIGGTGKAHGIEILDATLLNIYHNSINITSNDATNGRAFYSRSFSTSVEAINNIFANLGGGYAYYVEAANNVTLSNYNNLYTTGSNIGYWLTADVTDLTAWKTASSKDANSISVAPLFVSTTDLHTNQSQLDSAGVGLLAVSDDIDGEARDASRPDIGADEFDNLPDDIGVVAIVAPTSGCEFGDTVTIRVQNFGNQSKSNFTVYYQVDNNTPVSETITASVAGNMTYDYTFTTLSSFTTLGDYTVKAWTVLNNDQNNNNDTTTQVVTYVGTPSAATNLIPANGTGGITQPVMFSWSPANNATKYDLYVWLSTDPQPTTPTVADITGISYSYNVMLNFGATYNWTIVAKNDYCSATGGIQTFNTSSLPDLTVQMVSVPISAFSEQTISVSWEVKNDGVGSTGTSQWTDAIYLSPDQTLDIFADQYMKGVANLSALTGGQSYTNTTDITLPQGITGNYYVFVFTDRFTGVSEANEANNDTANTTAMLVNLKPPPDLQVTSVLATPTNVFSGSPLTVNFTVENKGFGATSGGFWRDRVYISNDSVWTTSATLLKTLSHTGALDVDSFYTQSTTVTVPGSIFGKHYIHVFTDAFDQIYEHAANSNNISRNDSINVILTPPPDLVPTAMVNPDTVSNLESVTISWTVQNQGGSAPTTYWYDRVYISNSPTFDINTATNLGSRYVNNQTLGTGAVYNYSRNIVIPNNITGTYYFYVFVDATERISEFTGETNNVIRSNAVLVGSPDLVVADITAPTIDTAGKMIVLAWDIKNQGNGDLSSRNRRDKLYMSTAPTLNVSSAIYLGELNYSSSIESDSILSRQKAVIIPNGISGNYYFYVVTDANTQIFELSEINNTGRTTNPTQIIIGPWADLEVTEFNTPDSTRAGIVVPLDFKVMNNGQGDATNANWIDKLYLSPNPTWQGVSNAILLKQFVRNTTLEPDSMYRINTNIVLPPLPAGVSTNICYVYAFTDADNNIFENTDEGNNILRSEPIFVEYPIPDLAITAIDVPSTAASGSSVTVNYTVTNIADTLQLSNYDYWYDGVYLSLDSIWDSGDIFVTDYQQYENQLPGYQYSDSRTFTIPNGLSGNYYLLLVTDHTYLSGDNSPTNNYDPEPINITLTPPPDLQVTAMTAPNSGISGQPVKIYYTVRNNGTGATALSAWQDKVYLSTDFTIDNNDIGYTANTHTGVLQPNEFYNDSITINTPVTFSGNYVILLKTDINDVVFELNNENNNTASTSISLTQLPPSDLIVENILLADTLIAGESATVTWTTKNNGSNPAIGQMQEAVYFSSDTILDANDVLFGIRVRNINLAPLATETYSISANLPGLPLGNYYALVTTDQRNNIYEANDTNNTSASMNTALVAVRELPMNVLMPSVLTDNQPIYYRIEIPNTLGGESLLIEMSGDSTYGRNELYLSYNEVPTRANFDYSHDDLIKGYQDLVVPSLQAGTYYLMVYGNDARFGANTQNITTKARILDFEIRSVTVNQGGNTGTVTVKVEGAKFTDNMTLKLQDASLDTITGMQLVYVDPATVFITFDLDGAPLGVYDVVASKPNGTSVALNDGFTVETSTGELLLTDIRHPSQTRFNRIVAITIEFTNGGNIDIPSPTRSIVSLRDAPLAFLPAGLSADLKDLFLEFFEINGPQHVLRPGATSSITVYSRANTAQRLRFKLLR